MSTPTRTKQPSERRLFNMEFRALLRAGASIASVTSAVAAAQGNVDGAEALTLGTTSYSGTQAQVWIETGGTPLEDYKVTIIVTTGDGEIVEGDALLQVREL